jgi:hypothetical protein
MNQFFISDNRLGISLPNLPKNMEEYTITTQEQILLHWEEIRGKIPDRIADIESEIDTKQHSLNTEEDFPTSCLINEEIADLASIINDLWLWFRVDQHIAVTKGHY